MKLDQYNITKFVKVVLSGLKQFLATKTPSKNDEKWFSFHFKNFFHSQDIYIFVLTFWSYIKNDLIRKIRLISKFITSQPD